MTAKDIINNDLPFLKEKDSVGRALEIMNDSRQVQLPFLRNNTFLGIFTEDLLLNYTYDTRLSEVPFLKEDLYLVSTSPILEVIKIFNSAQTDILPVFNSEDEWIGTLDRNSAQSAFISQFELSNSGGIIEILVKNDDFSFSEIARLIENEDTKIVFFYTSQLNTDNQKILSIKLNKDNISKIVAVLERFGYEVSSYYASEPVHNNEKDRYDNLMKYLNI